MLLHTQPLAPSQETMWEYLSFFSPEDPAQTRFNLVHCWPLTGELDLPALRAAVADVVHRHDALRLTFLDLSPDPTIRFHEAAPAPVEYRDLSGFPRAKALIELWRLLDEYGHRWFDFREGPLWTAGVIRLAAEAHVLAVSISHIVGDGWSVGVLMSDLAAAYSARHGQDAPLSPTRLSFAEVGHRAHTPAADLTFRFDYWSARLRPLPAEPLFTSLLPRPDQELTAETAYPFEFPDDVLVRLRLTLLKARMTPFVALFAAYAASLAVWSGRDRLVMGTTTAGRDEPGTREMVGQFTNNLYVAVTTRPDDTLAEVVTRVREEMVVAARHMVPFKAMARAANETFDAQRPWPFFHLYDAWFQSLHTHEPPAFAGLGVPDLSSMSDPEGPPAGVPGWSKRSDDPERMPVWRKRGQPAIMLRRDASGGTMVRNPSLFSEELVAELVDGYQRVVRALVEDPDRQLRALAPG